jgi:serine O-acetyltransferase
MKNPFRLFELLVFGGSKPRVRWHLRAMVYAREAGYAALGRFLEARLQRKYGLFISRNAIFPATLDLKHPTGVVIGEGVVLGENVKVYQNVTLGGARTGDWKVKNYPTIGDGTTIFAGAVVIGRISIGRNCTIGANAVVTRDVPDDSTAVGIPARVISSISPKVHTEHTSP